MKKIVFTGGGTAGHIYPNIAIISILKGWEIHYIGSHLMEEEILKGYPFVKFHAIDCVKFDRSNIIKNISLPKKLFSSIRQAKKLLRQINPCVVFSKGGFVALPVARAAAKLKIPVVTHESDLSLGLANKLISFSAASVCTTFEQTAKGKKFIFTGQPIRNEIFHSNKVQALEKLQYPTKPIILFVGGSSGAKKINLILKDPSFLTKDYAVVHITGKQNFENIKKQENYFPFAYINNIGDFYDAATIVITRAGSGVINELLALKKPMLMLPLSKKASRGDQIENAKLFSSLGYGEMLLDEELNKDNLHSCLEKMQKNIDFYKKNLQNAGENHAAEKIAKLLEKFC